jgi:hypothetical protein
MAAAAVVGPSRRQQLARSAGLAGPTVAAAAAEVSVALAARLAVQVGLAELVPST